MTLLRTALSNRMLARLLLSWAATSLGTWAFTVAFALFAYDQGGTAALGAAVTIRMLPAVLAAPYAAMLADRHSRRLVLLASTTVQALLLAAIGAAAFAGASLSVIVPLAALVTVASVAYRPAQSALMPAYARTPAELAAANACVSWLDYVGFFIGSLVAGTVAAGLGLDAALSLAGIPLIASAVLVLALRPDAKPVVPDDEPVEGVVTELFGGLRAIAADRRLATIAGLYGADMLVQGIIDVLLVVAAIELLGIGESGVGWLNAGWGAGGLIGGIAALVLLSRGLLARGLVLGCVAAGIPFALLAVSDEPAVAIALLVVLGIGFAISEVALDTFTQRLAAGDVLARVFGVYQALFVGFSALGALVAALLVELAGLEAAIVVTGVTLPVVALAVSRTLLAFESGVVVPERAFGLLRGVPLFASLPIATVETLALRATTIDVEDGTAIIAEGEVGDRFYVIDEGTVEVTIGGGRVRDQGPGEFFGEIALLHDCERTATVVAAGAVRLLVVDRAAFLSSIGSHDRSSRAAHAVASERLATTPTAV